MLSGVIYYKNHDHPTIFDEYNCGYEGIDGTMVMFPSQVLHHVEKQVVDTERITLAFNMTYADPLKWDTVLTCYLGKSNANILIPYNVCINIKVFI